MWFLKGCLPCSFTELMLRRNLIADMCQASIQDRSPFSDHHQRLHSTQVLTAKSSRLRKTHPEESCQRASACNCCRPRSSIIDDRHHRSSFDTAPHTPRTWAGFRQGPRMVRVQQRQPGAPSNRPHGQIENNAMQHATPSSNVSTRTTCSTA
jgi:hypothetical protein